jgi:hypothetical protein
MGRDQLYLAERTFQGSGFLMAQIEEDRRGQYPAVHVDIAPDGSEL